MSTLTVSEISEYLNMLEKTGGYNAVANALHNDTTFQYIASGVDRAVYRYKNVAIKIGSASSNYIEYFLFSKFRQHPRLVKYFPAQYSISPKRWVLICEYVEGRHPIKRYDEVLPGGTWRTKHPQDVFTARLSALLTKCGFENVGIQDLHAKNLIISNSEHRRVIIDGGHFYISQESPLYKQYSKERR